MGVLIFSRHQVDVHSAIQQRSRSETCSCLCLHAVFALEFLPRSSSHGSSLRLLTEHRSNISNVRTIMNFSCCRRWVRTWNQSVSPSIGWLWDMASLWDQQTRFHMVYVADYFLFILQLIKQLGIKWILRAAASHLAFSSWSVHCPDIQPENKAFHPEQTWRGVGCSPTAVSFVFHLHIIPISTHSQSCPSLFVLSPSV